MADAGKARGNGLFFGVLLFALVSFHAACNVLWLNIDRPYLIGDEAMHLNYALDMAEVIKTMSLKGFCEFFRYSPYFFPPFHHLVMALVMTASASKSVFWAAISNLTYLPLLILAVYFIGKKISCREAGMLAAVLVSFYPVVFGISRRVMVDFALMSMVALNIMALIYSEGFKNRGFSLLWGLSFGLGMLTKWLFVFFAFAPFVSVSVSIVMDKGYNKNKAVRNMLLGCLAAAVISAPWYINQMFSRGLFERLSVLYRYIEEKRYSDGISSRMDPGNIVFYLRQLFSSQISPLFTVVFIAGLIPFIKRAKPYRFIILSWLAAAYLFFTIMPNKNTRHTLAMLPAVGIVSSFAPFLFKGMARKAVFAVIFAAALVQYILVSFPPACRWQGAVLSSSYGYWASPPSLQDWRLDEVAEFILSRSPGKTPFVAWTFDYVGYDHNMEVMKYFFRKNGSQARLVQLPNSWLSAQDYQSLDFAILHSSPGAPFKEEYRQEDLSIILGVEEKELGGTSGISARRARRFDLPDGSALDILIFDKNGQAGQPGR